MATILEQYTGLKEKISTQIASGNFPYNQMLQYQEMLYRIDVLETCMAFVKTAPVTMDQRVLSTHYQMLDAFLMCMLQERKIGQPGDETVRKQRETAYTNFQTVVNTFRKQFSSFRPGNQDTYRNTIQNMVSTILPAWMSYRNTYVSL
jgi:hypothetical protein